MKRARSANELLKVCEENSISLSEYAMMVEMEDKQFSRESLIEKMKETLSVMREGALLGRQKPVHSLSGLIGGDAYKLEQYLKTGKSLTGDATIMAMAMAMSSSEVNGAMGKVVACPTAGSCGILPGALLTAAKQLGKNDDDLIKALFASAAIGMLIGINATFSGAEGGCQAECGSASAMASGAIVEMMGGTPQMSLDAAAIIFKNVMGLVCDPVAGLVEIPCAKRNVSGVVSALATADLVMAGVTSRIPFDDVLSAMYQVGTHLPKALRETALGGVAATPTGILLKNKVFGTE